MERIKGDRLKNNFLFCNSYNSEHVLLSDNYNRQKSRNMRRRTPISSFAGTMLKKASPQYDVTTRVTSTVSVTSPAVSLGQLQERFRQNHQLMAGQTLANGLPPGGCFRRQQQKTGAGTGAGHLHTNHGVTRNALGKIGASP